MGPKRKLIGVVGVDSGQLMVCDPCYLNNHWSKTEYAPEGAQQGEFSYNGCCKATLGPGGAGQLNYSLGHAGVGVAFSSGYGDGLYEVFATYNDDGRIVKVEIEMD